MVEAIVSFAVKRLGDALIQEAVSLHGVREQVEQLGNELRRMLCFLKDADVKQQQDDALVRNWISEIRDVAYESEDVIDIFVLKVASRERGGIMGLLIKSACILNISSHQYKVGTKIQSILTKFQYISDSRVTYDIESIRDERNPGSAANQKLQQQLRRSYPHVEDEDVIGLEEHTSELIAELTKEKERHCVISIIVTGGLGKTTLAKTVYRHDVVKNHFQFCAWTFVSQSYLVQLLHEYLQDKRYLVVLDDIWSSEAWDILSPAFPNGLMGKVALRADPWSLHLEPRFLTDEESWGLLWTRISPGLQKIGREMVRKCGSLPLGVTVLGGLLATKKTEITEREAVQRNINTHMNRGQTGPCFLYLGLFPEDCDIPVRTLIQLWTAEDFIPQLNGDTLEDLAEQQYLTELFQRCMVQVSKRSLTGRVKTCRLHDLMRDLCLLRAREENFLDIRHNEVADSPTTKNSYLFFDVQLHHQNLKLLRVVDLRGVYDDTKGNITKQIGKLVHLRKNSPTIGNLRYLQTLDLSGYCGTMPDTIQKMEQLRHLHLYCGDEHLQLRNLTNLQTLKWVTAGRWIIRGGLRQLLGSELEKILDSIVHRSTNHNPLRSLYLHLDLTESFPNMERLSRCHNLQKLSLRGFCRANYFKFPPNITKLTLATTCFFQDPWADLQHLPNLKYICMKSAYNGEEMKLIYVKQFRVHKGGMLSLKHLEIFNCQRLVMLPKGLKFVTTIQKLEINNMPSAFQDRASKKGADWYKVRHISSITFKVTPGDEIY
ncbi:hypothetical protein MKX01_022769 [Papaver californicum]|nr:hypothetical protein MKX01_022769 [Papaver californicum]